MQMIRQQTKSRHLERSILPDVLPRGPKAFPRNIIRKKTFPFICHHRKEIIPAAEFGTSILRHIIANKKCDQSPTSNQIFVGWATCPKGTCRPCCSCPTKIKVITGSGTLILFQTISNNKKTAWAKNLPILQNLLDIIYSMNPSLSITRRTSSKTAEMFSFGNLS